MRDPSWITFEHIATPAGEKYRASSYQGLVESGSTLGPIRVTFCFRLKIILTFFVISALASAVDAVVFGDLALKESGELAEEEEISHFSSEFDIIEFDFARKAIAEKKSTVEDTYSDDGKRFEEAQKILFALNKENPEDMIYLIYLVRCERLINQGIPEGWNGVELIQLK